MALHPNFDPTRFLDAQKESYTQALQELQNGRKRSHWMWFVFPQLEGLGTSPAARHYALKSLDDARAYLAHPVLGQRLRAATQAVITHPQRRLAEIFGHPDDLKFRSSMTLFAQAAGVGDVALFRSALDVFFNGVPDPMTLQLLNG